MFDLGTIERMNRQASRSARGQEPYFIKNQAEIDSWPPFPFPNFGDYRATKLGWKMTKTYFVDSSGFGSSGEPALTTEEFKKCLKVGKAYAIIEAGQFQVYVGEFEKVG